MAFWRTWSWDASAIDSLLDSEGVTLEQILNENDILTEAKAQNKKLIDFLIKTPNLEQFLSYVTEEHPELNDEAKYKYPYLVCDILCTDIQALYEAIFADTRMLDKILDFWLQEEPLNHLLAGYVNRITGCFLAKRKTKVITQLKEKENFLERSLSRIEESNVVDLLLKLIACDELEVPTISWLSECNLISQIFELYDPSRSSTVHENASQLLSGIIVISAQNISTGGDCRLLRQLEDEDTIADLLKRVLENSQSSVLLYGISVVIELLRQTSSDIFDCDMILDDLAPLIGNLVSYGDTLNRYLLDPPKEKVETSFGTLSPPLGVHRHKIIELIGALVNSRYICIYNALLDTPIFSTLMDLFFQYHWNNFLHCVVANIFTVILESNESSIITKLLDQTQLHTRLAEVALEDVNSFNNNLYQRRGYMGFVTKLTASVQLSLQSNDDLANKMDECEIWQKYLSETYAQTQEIQNKALGWKEAAGGDSSDEDEPEQIGQFQHIVKRDFENDFPSNFAISDFEDSAISELIHPTNSFVGILCEEPKFGDEFGSDEEL